MCSLGKPQPWLNSAFCHSHAVQPKCAWLVTKQKNKNKTTQKNPKNHTHTIMWAVFTLSLWSVILNRSVMLPNTLSLLSQSVISHCINIVPYSFKFWNPSFHLKFQVKFLIYRKINLLEVFIFMWGYKLACRSCLLLWITALRF